MSASIVLFSVDTLFTVNIFEYHYYYYLLFHVIFRLLLFLLVNSQSYLLLLSDQAEAEVATKRSWCNSIVVNVVWSIETHRQCESRQTWRPSYCTESWFTFVDCRRLHNDVDLSQPERIWSLEITWSSMDYSSVSIQGSWYPRGILQCYYPRSMVSSWISWNTPVLLIQCPSNPIEPVVIF